MRSDLRKVDIAAPQHPPRPRSLDLGLPLRYAMIAVDFPAARADPALKLISRRSETILGLRVQRTIWIFNKIGDVSFNPDNLKAPVASMKEDGDLKCNSISSETASGAIAAVNCAPNMRDKKYFWRVGWRAAATSAT